MQYRTVPKNGDKLSVLGFGTMRLPLKGENVDEERALNQIRFAIENGVNYVDSAPPYHGGESESSWKSATRWLQRKSEGSH